MERGPTWTRNCREPRRNRRRQGNEHVHDRADEVAALEQLGQVDKTVTLAQIVAETAAIAGEDIRVQRCGAPRSGDGPVYRQCELT